MKYQRIFKMLQRAGHGPLGALEVIVDATRGDVYAIDWIKMIRFQERH